MRASRLVELLLLLQVRGDVSAPELARELEVSTRTVYRDVEALAAAGVPVYAEAGRGGGIRLAADYRAASTPAVADDRARRLLVATVPSVDAAVAGDAAASTLRERLLIETEPWWEATEPTPHLATIAAAVWSEREVRMRYRSRDVVVRPLGLVLKAGTWYLMARTRGSDRMYRLSRVAEVTVLPHRFERPSGFDLAGAWGARKEAFASSIPRLDTVVRVSREGRDLVGLLQEGTPPQPLPDADADGWTTLHLRFERVDSAARLLLQLGGDADVIDPPELRERVRAEVARMSRIYRRRP